MKILLTGGGTGGHIYPALALQREIKKQYPESEFLYIGTEGGLESRIVPQENIPFQAIQVQGFKRSLSLDTFKTVALFLKAMRQSRRMIQAFQPDVVIGTGGYVCGPVVFAASRLKIPTIIHEQNSIAGVTNKFLARYVDRIALSFEAAATDFKAYSSKLVLTGNPRAQEVADVEKEPVLEAYGLNSDLPTVLIFGGSRGALKINETFKEAYPALAEKDYQTLFISGESYYADYEGNFPSTSKLSIVPYVHNMPQVFTNVDLVVSRAGATTLAELTALGKVSVLIPSPNVTADHQTQNALSLVEEGAALMLKEEDLEASSLIQTVDSLMMDPGLREKMGQASRKMGIADASNRMIQVIKDIVV